MTTVRATIETISKLEKIEMEDITTRWKDLTKAARLGVHCTSVLSPLPIRIWRNFIFVIYVQIVIMDNDVFMKQNRKRRGYMRSQHALSPLVRDERFCMVRRTIEVSLSSNAQA
jgi:uncharacterized Zn finger protein